MPKKKASRRFPPITDPHEWIYFDWEYRIIIRHLEHSVANSIEYPMPDEFKIENGCRVRRLDTGEIVNRPLSICRFTVGPKLFYLDDSLGDFFDPERRFVEVLCEVIPGIAKPKPKSKAKHSAAKTETPKASKSNQKAANPKSGLLF